MIAGYLAWKWWHRGDEANVSRGQETLFDRFWIDHAPKSESDRFQAFFALKQKPFGHFAQRTAWTGSWEGFLYKTRGDGQLELRYPHSKSEERVSYRAWKCNEPQFDFCLEMSGGKGARKYYSRRGWEVHGEADEHALEESVAR